MADRPTAAPFLGACHPPPPSALRPSEPVSPRRRWWPTGVIVHSPAGFSRKTDVDVEGGIGRQPRHVAGNHGRNHRPPASRFAGLLLAEIARLETRIQALEGRRKTPHNSSLPPRSGCGRPSADAVGEALGQRSAPLRHQVWELPEIQPIVTDRDRVVRMVVRSYNGRLTEIRGFTRQSVALLINAPSVAHPRRSSRKWRKDCSYDSPLRGRRLRRDLHHHQ